MATTPQPSARSRACSRPCSGAASRPTRMTRARSAPAKNEKPAPASVWPQPRNPPIRFRRRARSRVAADPPAGFGRRADRAGAQSQARAQAGRAGSTGLRRAETADAGRYHQFPRLLGRHTDGGEAGYPAQVAALRARQALAAARSAADRQRLRIVQQGAGLRAGRFFAGRSRQRRRRHRADPAAPRPSGAQSGAAATEINTVVAKGAQGQDSVVATSTRLAAAQGNSIWMRVVMLAPSASHAMSTTVLGDPDMTLMRSHFVKPQAGSR